MIHAESAPDPGQIYVVAKRRLLQQSDFSVVTALSYAAETATSW